jgi:hypothetical protein
LSASLIKCIKRSIHLAQPLQKKHPVGTTFTKGCIYLAQPLQKVVSIWHNLYKRLYWGLRGANAPLFFSVNSIMSAWTKFATNYYQEQKKKNPAYKFSDALKAAAKLYKKPAASSSSSPAATTQKKSKSKKRRTARRRNR